MPGARAPSEAGTQGALVPSARARLGTPPGAAWSRARRRRLPPGGSRALLGSVDEQHAVDLVDLDELHLDALVARRREVLADVVGPDRQLAVAAVGEHGELNARRPAVVEEGLDRGADRPAGVEDVVDEDARLALEREVEPGGANDGLRVERRFAAADLDVVAVEGDVDGAEVDVRACEVLDQAAEPLRERDAAGVDADERDPVEVGVALEDLVGDAMKRPVEGFRIEEDALVGWRVRRLTQDWQLLSGLAGPG